MTQIHAKFELIGQGISVDCSRLRYISIVILLINFSNTSSLLPPRSQNPPMDVCDNAAEHSSDSLRLVQRLSLT